MAPCRLPRLFGLLGLLGACSEPEKPDSDTDTDTDTAIVRPLGDNLVAVGTSAAEALSPLEPTGTLSLGGDRVVLCSGTDGLAFFDVSDPAVPTQVSGVVLPRPSGFRCQNLDVSATGALVLTHHGDETGVGWVALVDVSDPTAPVARAGWQSPGFAPEGVALAGDAAYVAMHDLGLYRFDVSSGSLPEPTAFGDVTGNAYSVGVAADGRIAVGTVEGTVAILDTAGALVATIEVSGPVRDLEWLPDGMLVAACGSSGLDLVDPGTASVRAHADVYGSALDATVLADGTIAVADWSDLRLYTGGDLTLLGVENPASGGASVALFGIDAAGDQLFVGEWRGLRTYSWDPSVSAPDIRADVARIDLGTVASGTVAAYALVLRNEGPRPLMVSGVASSSAAVTVDRTSLEIPAGGADFVELTWISDGRQLDGTVTVQSDDPDEAALLLRISANLPTTGVGDVVPEFSYLAFNGTETWNSRDLGGPALLTYFATF